jgi:polyhydroxyalkanoate synthase
MAALRMKAYLASAEAVLHAKGVLPVDWIQMLFASIDPLFAFNKFRAYAAMDPASDEARRFVIVEDWLNDGVVLTAPAARQALQQWYIDNEPVNGVWTIGADLVDTAHIDIPVLVVAATGDRLVPEASAKAFMAGSDKVTQLGPDIGHIGMMASNRAVDEVWRPVAGFLAEK